MPHNHPEIYLLDGLRTPFGRYRGALASLSTIDLGSTAIRALLARNEWASNPSASLFGVVVQAGLGQNPARIAAAAGGVSLSSPALTLNSVCLASLEAVCDATRRIRSSEGTHYLVGGFDSMSRAPRILPLLDGELDGDGDPYSALMSDGLSCALSGGSMGEISDRCNQQLNISREAQDLWASMSHTRAAAATSILQRDEIFPVLTAAGTVGADQGIRTNSTLEGLAQLRPAFAREGTITAGNASQLADGASVGLVVDAVMADRSGRTPLARIVDWGWTAGPDASLHTKPADAIEKVLSQQGLKASDIDLFEINEAFAGVAIASSVQLGVPHDVVNVNGGAIALGHPLGATGFRLLLTLAHEMRRRRVKRGIASLCGGGGQGLAVLIENPLVG